MSARAGLAQAVKLATRTPSRSTSSYQRDFRAYWDSIAPFEPPEPVHGRAKPERSRAGNLKPARPPSPRRAQADSTAGMPSRPPPPRRAQADSTAGMPSRPPSPGRAKADSTAGKPSRPPSPMQTSGVNPFRPPPRTRTYVGQDTKARYKALDLLFNQTLMSTEARYEAMDLLFNQGQASTGASAAANGKLVQAQLPSKIQLTFEHGQRNIPLLWLRDCCPCSRCVSESSGQKSFATVDVPVAPEVTDITSHDDGSLQIVWANDFMDGQSHTSTFSPAQLDSIFEAEGVRLTPRRLWDRAIFVQDVDKRHIQYDDWMAGGKLMAAALKNLAVWGLVVIKNVPQSHRAVKDIGNQIGPLQSTFYGETWDVVSKPAAENVAYTNDDLCLHQDLMYVHDTPRIQLLHCMNNQSLGGDSLFSDGLRAAAELQLNHHDMYHTLATLQVNYHYHKNGNHYSRRRAVILHPANRRNKTLADNISWSPPFQAPFDAKTMWDLPKWHEAAKIFRDSLQNPANMLQFRLQPGDCVVFDNRRILHGRTNFDGAVGLRHLRGAYLSGETTTSAMRKVTREGLADILTMRPEETAKVEFRQAQEMFELVEGGAPQHVVKDVGSRGVGLRHLRSAYPSGETTNSAMREVTKEGLADVLTTRPEETAKAEFIKVEDVLRSLGAVQSSKQAEEMTGFVEGGDPQHVVTDVGSRGGAEVGAPDNTAVESHPSETPRDVVPESAAAKGKVPMRFVPQ